MGSWGSGRARPRLWSEKLAQGAKVKCSIFSVRRRTSMVKTSLSTSRVSPSILNYSTEGVSQGGERRQMEKFSIPSDRPVKRLGHLYPALAAGQLPQLLQQWRLGAG